MALENCRVTVSTKQSKNHCPSGIGPWAVFAMDRVGVGGRRLATMFNCPSQLLAIIVPTILSGRLEGVMNCVNNGRYREILCIQLWINLGYAERLWVAVVEDVQ